MRRACRENEGKRHGQLGSKFDLRSCELSFSGQIAQLWNISFFFLYSVSFTDVIILQTVTVESRTILPRSIFCFQQRGKPDVVLGHDAVEHIVRALVIRHRKLVELDQVTRHKLEPGTGRNVTFATLPLLHSLCLPPTINSRKRRTKNPKKRKERKYNKNQTKRLHNSLSCPEENGTAVHVLALALNHRFCTGLWWENAFVPITLQFRLEKLIKLLRFHLLENY